MRCEARIGPVMPVTRVIPSNCVHAARARDHRASPIV